MASRSHPAFIDMKHKSGDNRAMGVLMTRGWGTYKIKVRAGQEERNDD